LRHPAWGPVLFGSPRIFATGTFTVQLPERGYTTSYASSRLEPTLTSRCAPLPQKELALIGRLQHARSLSFPAARLAAPVECVARCSLPACLPACLCTYFLVCLPAYPTLLLFLAGGRNLAAKIRFMMGPRGPVVGLLRPRKPSSPPIQSSGGHSRSHYPPPFVTFQIVRDGWGP